MKDVEVDDGQDVEAEGKEDVDEGQDVEADGKEEVDG